MKKFLVFFFLFNGYCAFPMMRYLLLNAATVRQGSAMPLRTFSSNRDKRKKLRTSNHIAHAKKQLLEEIRTLTEERKRGLTSMRFFNESGGIIGALAAGMATFTLFPDIATETPHLLKALLVGGFATGIAIAHDCKLKSNATIDAEIAAKSNQLIDDLLKKKSQ